MSQFAVRILKPGPRRHAHVCVCGGVAAGFSMETRNSMAGVWIVIGKLRKHANMNTIFKQVTQPNLAVLDSYVTLLLTHGPLFRVS